MRSAVTQLRRHGMRLRPDELGEPVVGELQMRDWNEQNSFGRSVRVLEVVQPAGTVGRAALTLFEPDLVGVKAGAMVFRGIEIESRDGRVYEHEQIWRVAPAT